ncbi:hypothetical protein HK104_002458 [Borealophlyctis nickersoniae]|nr:hypothetical protein HK104_002458 [Borealophlyctis nickersoniae]
MPATFNCFGLRERRKGTYRGSQDSLSAPEGTLKSAGASYESLAGQASLNSSKSTDSIGSQVTVSETIDLTETLGATDTVKPDDPTTTAAVFALTGPRKKYWTPKCTLDNVLIHRTHSTVSEKFAEYRKTYLKAILDHPLRPTPTWYDPATYSITADDILGLPETKFHLAEFGAPKSKSDYFNLPQAGSRFTVTDEETRGFVWRFERAEMKLWGVPLWRDDVQDQDEDGKSEYRQKYKYYEHLYKFQGEVVMTFYRFRRE